MCCRSFAIVGVLAFLAPMPAFASDCLGWKAEVWEVEGGRALTAHICTPASGAERQAMLYLQCGEKGAYALRFDDGGAGDPPNGDPEWHGRIVFSDGRQRLDVAMTYEAMDGVLYAPAAFAGPLVDMLSHSASITLTPDEKTFKARTFTLKGSGTALARLARACSGR
ncbi:MULTISPECIES: hypothetical protein [Alphaproteobacteria]|uniref:Uncharacterized protein n=2 Tax=Alphaproteobacteria TaxID=28211 RepID=A0A512HD77_9HYPH|nr:MULTISPECIES: hypothetical protein [Alphaproteobacteria]GEO83412.1 hypothetical protein RNA01_03440 [Ciceribacter naphthalenivorans]GLR23015.1 hypothetical protein GCM10007920_28030 [Ciceribacter naphthalenivorans]GLT05871.1 hypothetical protein GCM10007926_28030 [Sphingomonas psychrolutea]